MWGSGTTAYKIKVYTAADALVKEIDNVSPSAGSTTLQSKTPSEYQIAFYENVSGSYILTNAQTENGYDFKYSSDGILLGSTKKFYYRDTDIYQYSSADGVMDFVADGSFQFNHATSDVIINFVGPANTGQIVWKEDEDYLQIMDDVFMPANENIYFGSTDNKMYSDLFNTYIYNLGTYIKLTNGSIIYDADSAGGVHYFNIDETQYITISPDGIKPTLANGGTLHVYAANSAPTSTTEGALWIDSDASANGDLMAYSNGAWRKVVSLP